MRPRSTPIDEPTIGLEAGPGNVLFDVWLVSRAVQALIDDAIKPVGLDADEFAIYSVLASSDGATPSALARWMAAPPTTVSSYVKRFERRGHIERVANPDDARSHILKLTPAGRNVHRKAGELFAPILAEVEEKIRTGADATHRHLWDLRQAVDTTRSDV